MIDLKMSSSKMSSSNYWDNRAPAANYWDSKEWQNGCWICGSTGHWRRDCPEHRALGARGMYATIAGATPPPATRPDDRDYSGKRRHPADSTHTYYDWTEFRSFGSELWDSTHTMRSVHDADIKLESIAKQWDRSIKEDNDTPQAAEAANRHAAFRHRP